MSNEVRANYGELSNEQLVIRIKAGEDVSGNMEQLYNQVRRFIHAPLPSDERQLFKVSSPLPGEGAAV